MQYKLLFVFAALLVCSQALTLSESAGTLYAINPKRYDDMLHRMKDSGFNDNRYTLLKGSITTFAFTCNQVTELISTIYFEDDRLNAIDIVKGNIIDPQNKTTIINSFTKEDIKKKATTLLATITACKTDGVAPEKFPYIVLPYKDQWNQTDLEVLVRKINKVHMSADKLQMAEDAITSTSKILTPEQACLIYESFSMSRDMLALTEFVKDRIVGLTCEQVISVLQRFFFEKDKLEALAAFKHNIIDVENKLIIIDSFSFIPNKEEARKILDDLRPKSYLFGMPTGKVVFALDTSTSMSTRFKLSTGATMNRLDFVKKEFTKTLSTFDNSTEFNVLAYSTYIRSWKTGGLQKATQANITDAITYSNKFVADGGTNIYGVLQGAWTIPDVDTIYLLTDGSPSVGVTDFNKIITDIKAWNAKKPIKVNTIAFLMGTEPKWDDKAASRRLMSAIAEATNGIYRAVESDN